MFFILIFIAQLHKRNLENQDKVPRNQMIRHTYNSTCGHGPVSEIDGKRIPKWNKLVSSITTNNNNKTNKKQTKKTPL